MSRILIQMTRASLGSPLAIFKTAADMLLLGSFLASAMTLAHCFCSALSRF